jgi:hypothetical protein
MWRVVILTVVPASTLAFLATGCGDSDGDGDGDGGSGDEGAPVRDIQPQAQQRAESIVLELSDFPNGWRASPAEDTQDRADEFRECLGADYSGSTINGEAESQNFAMGENAQAQSDSTVFESEQDAVDAPKSSREA